MKEKLQRLFYPLLKLFENESPEYQLTPTNRKVALAISITFLVISILIPLILSSKPFSGYFLQVLIFGSVGIVGTIVGSLGSDHAVAKLVGNRRK